MSFASAPWCFHARSRVCGLSFPRGMHSGKSRQIACISEVPRSASWHGRFAVMSHTKRGTGLDAERKSVVITIMLEVCRAGSIGAFQLSATGDLIANSIGIPEFLATSTMLSEQCLLMVRFKTVCVLPLAETLTWAKHKRFY
jgi:hypothetical protein